MSIPNDRCPFLVTRCPSWHRARGLSLVEVIVFIVVVGVAVAGVLAALNVSTRASADPVIQKQALAIAEAVLEEVQLMPFTYCDPDDPQAATAQNAGVGANGCSAAASVENPGPEANPPYGPESRLGATTPFDNVNDYNGFSVGPGIIDMTGAAITGLDGYTATVSVSSQAFAAFGGGRAIPSADALLVTVTVTGPANTTAVLHGYRVRYAPNALP